MRAGGYFRDLYPPDLMIDLRSDTVTQPTPEMRRAMAEAEVGDDVYGEDPSVNRLQDAAARMLGFEAALWVPSGTMANEIAIRILTAPGQEVLVEERSHVVQYELAGMAVLSGVIPRTVAGEEGRLRPEDVRAAVKPRVYYRSEVGLAVLENTHNLAGGTLYTVEQMTETMYACREAGMRVPEDLAIAGFDDIPIVRFITPSLTSVRVPIAELGTCAAQRLLDVLGGKPAGRPRKMVLPTTLVVRDSCGAMLRPEARAAGSTAATALAGSAPLKMSERVSEGKSATFVSFGKEGIHEVG